MDGKAITPWPTSPLGKRAATNTTVPSPSVVRAPVHLPSQPNLVPAEVEPYLRASSKKLGTDAVAQAAWAEKKWVWVEHKDEGYIAAHVVKETEDSYTIEFTDGKVRHVAVIIYEKYIT